MRELEFCELCEELAVVGLWERLEGAFEEFAGAGRGGEDGEQEGDIVKEGWEVLGEFLERGLEYRVCFLLGR